MPKKSTHSVLFGVRLSPQEHAQLEAFAKKYGKSVSEVARVLMRVGAVYAKLSDFGIDLTRLTDELTTDLWNIYDTCAGEKYGPAHDAATTAKNAIERISGKRVQEAKEQAND